jgi:hypothetical protein
MSEYCLSSWKKLLTSIFPIFENMVIFGRELLKHLVKICKKKINK